VPSFYKVAWSRSDMLDVNIVNYLNMLTESSDSCIISQSFANKMGLKVGESVEINQNDMGYKSFYLKIKGIIKAWPAYIYSKDDKGKLSIDEMIITNTNFLEKSFGDLTYEIWLKTDKNASVTSIQTQLNDNLHGAKSIHDYKNDVFTSENSAQRQSLNTLLSLSFIVIFAICLTGYLIYWILSIKSRIFQIGILRAMGLSAKSIYAMLALEQFLISIIPTVFSIVAGGVISRLFVNLLKVTFGADSQLIPFDFVSSQNDYAKIYIFFLAMFLINSIVVLLYIKKINITQTIKLGED
jgi:putative ABC transport system permease protein